jgi:hypothetical protein
MVLVDSQVLVGYYGKSKLGLPILSVISLICHQPCDTICLEVLTRTGIMFLSLQNNELNKTLLYMQPSPKHFVIATEKL